jgi:hypothetical protein
MRFSLILSFLVLALVTSACSDNTNPTAIVQSAAVKLEKNDLKGFRKLLSDSALEQYGSPEGMTILKKKLGGSTPKLSEPKLLNSLTDPTETTRSTYEISVLSADSAQKILLELNVYCESQAMSCMPVGGIVVPGCGELDATGQECKITSIR